MIEPHITHEPIIEVGIVSGTEIHFNLSAHYRLTGTYVGGCVVYSCYVQGPQTVHYADGQIGWQNKTFDTLILQPAESADSTFELQEVTIGIDFHWQRRENQTFGGLLKFVIEDERLTAVNVLPLEDYLVSVISSEMSAHASEELLKAHAVISRSWALAQMFSLTPDPSPKERGEVGEKQLRSYLQSSQKEQPYTPSPLSLGEGPGVRLRERTGVRPHYQTADPLNYSLLKEFQKDLKKEPTEAEKIVWEMLRNRQTGEKFRRQHIIGNYIVDFICVEKKLIIEIDGGYHASSEQKTYDEDRDQHLQAEGYTVLRFTNEEVISSPESVFEQIKRRLSAPSPLSLGEGSGVRHHTLYHVCADDHCQRYQGLTRPITEKARQAVADTRGQVLTSGGRLCDTRYSKCCGGAFEEFQYCWEDTPQPYLRKQRDWRVPQGDTTVPAPDLPDLTVEAEAERWIRSTPDAFCHTTDQRILKQVLNHYDQETTDFYRWRVEYTQEELSALIQRRSGVDYGQIIDLVPIARGTSGRIWQLKIVGTQQTRIIGKELVIRRTLSPSHLYSSAFIVDREDLSPEGIPARFILTGAGWGHGVGLCQIGAAVMGEQGYKYDEILKHYYVGTEIENIY